jgi:hypothetical protein
MQKDTFSWLGFLLRFFFALVLVYGTYNPEGYSYYHWIEASLNHQETGLLGSDALKFIAGILLLAGWTVYVNATRNSLGMFGVVLLLALCGGVIWFFIDMKLLKTDDMRLIIHLAEIVFALVLAVGMCWSHIHRRLTGQVDIDDHDR